MAKRNLNNLNHWIAELRDVAEREKCCIVDSDGIEQIITRKQINGIFCKTDCITEFEDGLSPEDAYETITDQWYEAEQHYCQSVSG